MADLEVIDAHIHFYRSAALEKQNVDEPGLRDRDHWANPESVNAFLDANGISHIVCLPNFPTPQMRAALRAAVPAGVEDAELEEAHARIEQELKGRLRRQNEWMCKAGQANPRLAPAISIQKLFAPDEMLEEVRKGFELGSRIVKMIPGFYGEYPADRAFWPMYGLCEELGVTVMSDSGTLDPSSTGIFFGEPVNFVEVLEGFPRLQLVMAHFGSAFWDERVELAGRFSNLAFDLAGGFNQQYFQARDVNRAAAVEDAVRLIRKVGVERCMFGTDGPRFPFHPQLTQLLSLDFTDGERKLLLSENAKRIYKITD